LIRENGRHHYGHETDHQPCKLINALVKTGQFALSDDTGGERSKVGLLASMDNDCRSGGRFPRLCPGSPIFGRSSGLRISPDAGGAFFSTGHGLTGERCLDSKQVPWRKAPSHRPGPCPRRSDEGVARYKERERHFGFLARPAPQSHSLLNHALSFSGGIVGATFLEEAQDHAH